jgi:cell division protein FtsI (penicillin-binding protein 3)
VLLVMVLLAVGLVATLWLSTAAAADSYRLQDARTATRDLTEQSELLRKQVAALDASPALARRASDLGMVPSQNPARLVVGADGAVTLVGEPSAAQAPPPPPAPPADPGAQAQTPPPADAGAPDPGAAGAAAAGTGTPPPAAAETPGAQTPGAQTPGAQTPGAQAPGAQAQTPAEPPAGTNAATEDAQSQADAGTPTGGAG